MTAEPDSRSPKHLRLALALSLFALSGLLLAGCTWTGKGKEVADAFEKTAAIKTATYSGSMKMQIVGAPGTAAGDDTFDMTFTGAADSTNPAAPKASMTMEMMGERIEVAEPGDGNIYMASRAGAYGAPINPVDRAKSEKTFARILAALEPAIGNFRDGSPMTTNEGTMLKPIVADGNRGKICSGVVPAFGDYMSAAGSGESGFDSLGGGLDIESFCKSFLTADPTLWFGIDDGGLLRMIAVEAKLAVPGAEIKLSLRFDVGAVDQPVSIEKPRGVRMLASQAELERQVGAAAAK
ncbi:MAG: hypothetical protein WAP35_06755 [Solirubrobacterales bacterium]